MLSAVVWCDTVFGLKSGHILYSDE
jgi:hypothetical protein